MKLIVNLARGRQKNLEDKQIKAQSRELEKNKSSDSKVFYVVEDSDEATEALLDEIYGKEEEEEEKKD